MAVLELHSYLTKRHLVGKLYKDIKECHRNSGMAALELHSYLTKQGWRHMQLHLAGKLSESIDFRKKDQRKPPRHRGGIYRAHLSDDNSQRGDEGTSKVNYNVFHQHACTCE